MIKEHNTFELNNEDESQEPHTNVESQLEQLTSNESLRFQLLVLSKEILMGRAAMKWETHKQYVSVTINDIVDEANKMYTFVKGVD